MKKIEKEYLEFFDKIRLSNDSNEKIKNNIINNKNYNLKHRFAYVTACSILAFSLLIGAVYASELIRKFTITSNEGESTKVNFDSNIEKDYSVELIDQEKTYTINEIEKIFDLKLLNSERINGKEFKVLHLENYDNYISYVSFELVDENKGLNDTSLSFTINTKYSSKNINSEYKGTYKLSYYHIKSIDEEAALNIPSNNIGIAFVDFQYNNVIYNYIFDCTKYSTDDIYSYLESFK